MLNWDCVLAFSHLELYCLPGLPQHLKRSGVEWGQQPFVEVHLDKHPMDVRIQDHLLSWWQKTMRQPLGQLLEVDPYILNFHIVYIQEMSGQGDRLPKHHLSRRKLASVHGDRL